MSVLAEALTRGLLEPRRRSPRAPFVAASLRRLTAPRRLFHGQTLSLHQLRSLRLPSRSAAFRAARVEVRRAPRPFQFAVCAGRDFPAEVGCDAVLAYPLPSGPSSGSSGASTSLTLPPGACARLTLHRLAVEVSSGSRLATVSRALSTAKSLLLLSLNLVRCRGSQPRRGHPTRPLARWHGARPRAGAARLTRARCPRTHGSPHASPRLRSPLSLAADARRGADGGGCCWP